MFFRKRRQADFADELQQHIAHEKDRLQQEGLSAEEADAQARRSFGNVTATEERFYESQRWLWWDRARSDIRIAIRQLLESPAFSLAAILTLGLGIGANTAIFSVADAVAFRPLPYPESDRIISVYGIAEGKQTTLAPADFLALQHDTKTLQHIAAYRRTAVTISGPERAEPVDAAVVTTDFFAIFQSAPQAGRLLNRQLDAPGSARTAVISDPFWRRRFAADPGVVGKAITVNGEPVVLVGVMSADFRFPAAVDLWLSSPFATPPHPLRPAVNDSANRGSHYFDVVARVRSGTTVTQARVEADHLLRTYAKQSTSSEQYEQAQLIPIEEELLGAIRKPILLLSGAVSLLLFIACFNVANLVIARGETRRKEIAMRAALGAGRFRIVQQLLTETLLLSTIGCATGLLFARLTLNGLTTLLPLAVSSSLTIRIDLRVFTFAAAAALFCGLLAGIYPALSLSRTGFAEMINESTRGTSRSRRALHARETLVVAQIAFTTVLLVLTALLSRSYLRLLSVPSGFNPEPVVAARVYLSPVRYAQPEQRGRFVKALLERLADSGDLTLASVISRAPTTPGNSTRTIAIPGKEQQYSPDYLVVSPNYFRAMQIRLLTGRLFSDRDDSGLPAVIISRAAANQFWGTQNPLGLSVRVGADNADSQVVGVVEDVRQHGLDSPVRPTIYVPYARDPWPTLTVVGGVSGSLLNAERLLKETVQALDPDQALYDIRPMTQVVAASYQTRRIHMTFVSAFGGVALALSIVGIAGLVAFTTAMRYHEIGIRIALGADRLLVVWTIVRQILAIAAIGTMTGLLLSLIATRWLGSMLFDIGAFDIASFAIAATLLISVAALVSVIQARHAAMIDPAVSLRSE